MSKRIICWFSCGAASAVAAKLALLNYKTTYPDYEIQVVRIFLQDEHEDSNRFAKDCEKWLGVPILTICDGYYSASVDQVIAKTKYMAGVNGARCTKELKKAVRYKYQKANDVHVFGMHTGEQDRIDNLIDNENELQIWNVLIENNFTKQDCLKMLVDANIEIPMMYKLGYNNNNCIGCLKAGGAGYWNKIRVDFPEVFKKRAKQEQLINVALVKISLKKLQKKYPECLKKMADDWYQLKTDKAGQSRVPLRYLPENAGSHKSIHVGDCGFFCEKSEDDFDE